MTIPFHAHCAEYIITKKALTDLMIEWVDLAATDKPVG
jgi:hypothetical protein